MKPITTYLTWGFVLLCAAFSRAQAPTFTVSPQSINMVFGQTYAVEIKVSNFTDIALFNYAVQWKNNLMVCDSVRFPNPPVLTGANLDASATSLKIIGDKGFLNTAWSDNEGDGNMLTNGTKLYTMYFRAVGNGEDTIRFGKLSNNIQLGVGNSAGVNVGMVQQPSFVVAAGAPPPPPPPPPVLVGWAVLTDPAAAVTGGNISIPIKVQDFTTITSVQYYTFWDKTKLEFQGVEAINLMHLGFDKFTPSPINTPANIATAQSLGKLGIGWFDASAATLGVTVPNNTVIYKLKFKILAASATTTTITFGESLSNPMSTTEVVREVPGTGPVDVPFQSLPCTVTITAAPDPGSANDWVVYSDTVTVGTGSIISMPIKVQGFKNISSFQYFSYWDNTKLEYQGVESLNLASLGLNKFLPQQTSPANIATAQSLGKLGISWLDDSPATLGVTVPNNTVIYRLKFKVLAPVGAVINLTFDGSTVNPALFVAEVESQSNGVSVPLVFRSRPAIVNVSTMVPCEFVIDSVKNIKCKGQSNGAIFTTATGGAGTWTYSWTGPSFVSSLADITNIKAGSYFVTATNGTCSIVRTQVLTEPDVITLPSVNVTNVKCFGGSDGAINITPAGGTVPFTFAWAGLNFTSSNQNITGLKGGTYQVIVTDKNGCTASSGPITVAQPQVLAYNSSLINVNPVKCFGGNEGAISLNNAVSGGTQPYSYSWSGPPAYTATSKEIVGLKTGQYICSVTDANSCTFLSIGPLFVTQPTTELAVTIISVKDVNCFGASTGEICVSVTGGTLPYAQQWNAQGTSQTGLCLSNRPAGPYTFTVVDANGCSKSITATIGGPAAALGQSGVSVNQVSCFGGNDGSACITATGGSPTYSYAWSCSGSQTNCAQNLTKGDCSVTVTDLKGCTFTQTISVPGPSSPITVSNNTPIINGNVTLNVNGGTPTYQYLWDDGNTNANRTGLAPGAHCLTVTDSKQCTKTHCVTVTSSMAVTVLPGDKACKNEINGSCIVNIVGGTPPFTLTWTGGGPIITPNSPYEIGGLAGNTVITVTVTDANGSTVTSGPCIIFENSNISANTAVSNANPSAYNDGSMLVEVTSGTAPFAFSWTKDALPILGTFITSGIDTSKITGQSKGKYCANVTDAAGCSAEFCNNIKNAYPALIVDVIATPSNCKDSTNGSATLNINGGDGTYSIVWTMPNGSTTTSQNLTGLKKDNYQVVVKDGSGQIVQKTAIITSLSALAVFASVTSSCSNFDICTQSICDGIGTAAATGAFGAVKYEWTNGEITQTAEELCAGQNCVTVTDAAGCAVVACFNVSAPASIISNLTTPILNSCFGICNGTAQANPVGGVQPYSYEWSSGETTEGATKLCSGFNTVKIIDKFGIVKIDTFEINGPGPLSVSFDVIPPADIETCDGRITANVVNGQGNIQYRWNKLNKFDKVIDDACPGECLLLIISDSQNCTFKDTVCVGYPSDGCYVGSKVMTPSNGDLFNDLLFISCADGALNSQLEVFNRWGQLVYSAKNYNSDWNGTYNGLSGKFLPEGVYFWVFSFENQDGDRIQRKDYVTILRGDQ